MNLITLPERFIDLRYNLEVCDQLFLQHQIHLMHKDFANAFNLFEKLVKIRFSHLHIMEELLLPAYEKIFQEPPSGAKSIYFIREKRLILKHLDKHIRMLSEILLHSRDLSIVSLFEEYAWLKDLMDHHDAREKAFLLTGLDKRLPETEKKLLLAEISSYLNQLQKDIQ